MESVRRFYRQTLDLFRSLTPGGRLLAALLCGLITVSLAWLVRYQSVESYEYLLGGQHFARREIEAIEVAFASQGLRGSEVVGQQIRIPRGRKQEFLAALAKGDALPDRFNPDEMLLEGGLLDPRDVRDQRQRIAGQNKLAMLIEKMPGIETASVQIDEVRIGSFPTRIEKRAIALVSASGRRPLLAHEVRAIRETLVGYIAGITHENVTVTDLEAMQAYPAGEPVASQPEVTDPYAISKRTFETMWREKILERLAN
jgi:flagellar M-ring protein FliF